MKHITFYFDFISPYAYFALEKLPDALAGVNCTVSHKPVLFAGLLQHHGQLGPAEIESKRDWTYRQIQWIAHANGIDLRLPAAHPFNPLALLRLAIAAQSAGHPNRSVCTQLFRYVWCSGQDPADPDRLASLTTRLAPVRDPDDAEVKAQLKTNTEEAIARGVFGVPTFAVDDKLFWGLDSLPMLRAYLDDDPWFRGDAWDATHRVQVGARRRKQQPSP